MASVARISGRRAFLGAGIAALPIAIFGHTTQTASAAQATLVSAGTDRFGEHRTIGISSTAFKVASADSRGDLSIMEHSNHKKGGVPRTSITMNRSMFGHSGWCATLEDWFDPRRTRDDYVPTGFRPYGMKTYAVKGHPFGLNLSAEDKRALIAFLKTL